MRRSFEVTLMTLQAHCGADLSLGGLGDLPVVAFFE